MKISVRDPIWNRLAVVMCHNLGKLIVQFKCNSGGVMGMGEDKDWRVNSHRRQLINLSTVITRQ